MYAPRFSVESQYRGAEKTRHVNMGEAAKYMVVLTCDAASVVLDFVSIHTDFVTADNSLEAVVLAEALGNIRAELHTNTSFAGTASLLFLGIRPQHLHHETSLARLSLVVSVQLANIIEGDLVVGEETAVEDKILVTDQSGQRQSGETLGEELECSAWC